MWPKGEGSLRLPRKEAEMRSLLVAGLAALVFVGAAPVEAQDPSPEPVHH
jgi:hypothetical protein